MENEGHSGGSGRLQKCRGAAEASGSSRNPVSGALQIPLSG